MAGEFHNHATTLLSIGLFERHDRETFEIFAFDNGGDDLSPMRARFTSAVPNVVSITGLSDQEAARRIIDAEIDILVNLNGHVGLHRTGVFAQKLRRYKSAIWAFPAPWARPTWIISWRTRS